MKYIILDKDNTNILKMGNYIQLQLDKYSNQGFSIEEMPNDFPKNKRKWEVKKDNNKYKEKTKKEIEDYWKEKEVK